MNNYKPEKENVAERRFLIIFSMFSILLSASTLVNSYTFVALISSWLGIILCWSLYFFETFNFKTRAIILLSFSLVDYIIYGMVSDDFFVALLPYVLIVSLVSILEIKGFSYLVSITYVFIIIFHFFIKKSVSIENSNDICKLVLAIMLGFSIELITYWRMVIERQRTAYLEEMIEGLKVAQKGKDEFLANVSHEIRTPLNTLSGMTELLDTEILSDDNKERIFYIRNAERRLRNLVSDIIDYTELQTDKINIVNKNYNYSSVFNDVVSMVVSNYDDKKLEFIIDCDPNIPSGLIGDSDKLYRILCCVLDNAFKFTDKGYVYFSTTARREKYGVNLVLTIKDSGIGMSPETLEKIFDYYNQADTDRNRKREGIGLGLSIARKMVDLMGGFIHIDSKLDEGTIVTIMIPQKVVSNEPLTTYVNADVTSVAFYVDSEKYNQSNTLSMYLKTYNHIAEGLGIRYVRCESIAKLKYGIKRGKYTHIFMSIFEYYSDKEFFDDIAKSVPIIVIVERDMDANVGKNINCIHKPFSVFNVAAVMNGEVKDSRLRIIENPDEKWCAPDARILCVDDNRMNLKVLDGLLRKYKISISKAYSGKECLEMIKSADYDFVFMDHMMPEMDGIETFRNIRNIAGEYFQRVPVIALTANAVNGAREMFLDEGFQDYVSKPIDQSTLKRVLLTYIPEEKILHNVDIDNKEVSSASNNNDTKVNEITDTKIIDDVKDNDIDNSQQVLNTKIGIEYAGDDKQLYRDLMESYLEDTVEVIDILENSIKNDDFDNYKINIHALKSTSLQMGATKLYELAKQSEAFCKEGDNENVKQLHTAVIKNYEIVCNSMRAYLKSESE